MPVTIYGIQAAQAALNRVSAVAKPGGPLAQAVQEATVQAQRYAIVITHVDTGALKGAHVTSVRGHHGEVYINPAAARSDGRRPAQYGPYEHERGGSHAFYERVIDERGAQIAREAGRVLMRALP